MVEADTRLRVFSTGFGRHAIDVTSSTYVWFTSINVQPAARP